jgi:hypothetical protein
VGFGKIWLEADGLVGDSKGLVMATELVERGAAISVRRRDPGIYPHAWSSVSDSTNADDPVNSASLFMIHPTFFVVRESIFVPIVCSCQESAAQRSVIGARRARTK